MLGLGVNIYARYWLSRVKRPSIPACAQRHSGLNELEVVPEEDEFGGWLRIALIEEEIILHRNSDGGQNQRVSVNLGAVSLGSSNGPQSGQLPFSRANWRYLWSSHAPNNRPAISPLEGPIVALAYTDTWLGRYALLNVTLGLGVLLGVQPSLNLDRLQLRDAEGTATAVFRCWWQLRATDRGESYPYVSGCELLAHPDLVARMARICVSPIKALTIIERIPLVPLSG